ncbi:MAG: DUF305 domain-containing protein [Acidimicrobiales bacterium]
MEVRNLVDTVGELSPARRWDDPMVLVALAAIVVGALWLGSLVVPRAPSETSAEVGFARDMSVHHAQGVGLAELIRSRTTDAEVRTLATDIALAQQAQIARMSGWLQAWGVEPTGSGHAMEWMDHPTNAPMPGMATPADLASLGSLGSAGSGEMEVSFLRLMIRHHRGGVLMARAVLARTDHPKVATLARAVVAAQRAEVAAMDQMLLARARRR